MAAEHDSPLMKRAGALLARRSFSRGELRRKLAPEADDVSVEETLDRLEKLNLLNDSEYAYNFALRHIQQAGWSPAKVEAALLRHDLSPEVIRQTMERIAHETDSAKLLVDYINKRCRKQRPLADPKEVHKLMMHLMRRGFDENQIRDALKQITPPNVFRHFETGD